MDYWKRAGKVKDRQTAKGLAEYGQTLEENTKLHVGGAMKNLEEELVDAIMYCEHAQQMYAWHDVDELPPTDTPVLCACSDDYQYVCVYYGDGWYLNTPLYMLKFKGAAILKWKYLEEDTDE